MREMLSLFMAVVLFSAISGGVLAFVQQSTEEKIEYQQLKFVKGPAIQQILEGCSNDPLNDRFKVSDGDIERSFFIGEFDGKKNTVAFETSGKGFGGDINVIVAVNVETDEIVGIGVTTHAETPGLGSRTKDDPDFSAQFKGLSINDPFKVKSDGGQIDALSGATVSSRGVCGAVSESSRVYLRLKAEIVKQL